MTRLYLRPSVKNFRGNRADCIEFLAKYAMKEYKEAPPTK
ncbi:hypothetical protein TcasGA2_TC007518 [Tribolium castaneum]|uniref:Uncharacterized protein n=1 Tax=Tribolium castaneum TaxID=7070 RepID=D2A3H8_TRICA|nr:hypothetical protein TcasGA2_TC007518 [Tribolium castaneum]